MNSRVGNIFIFLISIVTCSQGQQGNNNTTTNEVQITFPEIPKCCVSRTKTFANHNCTELDSEPSYSHFFFESNITHINNDSIEFNPTFYKYIPVCTDLYRLESNEVLGFIYNGSIITYFDFEVVPPTKYCVDSVNQTIAFIICSEITPERISKGQVYFPCLIVSTFCYFFSAIVYQFVLKVTDVHKKCFVGFSFCMGITFFFLILLQKINTGCEFLGSIFFVFILASFVWLCCLCLDIVYVIRNFLDKDENLERINLYIAAAIAIPCVVLTISLIPTGIPDVPKSFLKDRGMCNFKDDESRISILFIPMGLLLITSLASLIYGFYLINLNSKKFKSDINWLEKHQHFKYMIRSCCMIWLTTTIWVLDAALKNMNLGNPLVYEIIEGCQGIFVVAVFVTNRYTRKDIYRAVFGKKPRTADAGRFRKLLEKFKNEEKNNDAGGPSERHSDNDS